MLQHRLIDNVADHGVLPVVSGLTVVEKGDAAFHKTILTLDEVVVDMTDGSTPGTDAMWGTKLLYSFPAGKTAVLGAHQIYPAAGFVAGAGGIADDANFEVGVGQGARENDSNFVLASVEDDIIPGQNAVTLASGVSDGPEASQLNASKHLASDANVMNLNIITRDDADAGTAADTLTVSGVITIIWASYGAN